MDLDKLNIMLKNGTITQNEYNEMKSKLGTKGKNNTKNGSFLLMGILLFFLSPILTFGALPIWGKIIMIISMAKVLFLSIEPSFLKKRLICNMNRKEDFSYNFLMSDIKTQMFNINLVLIIGLGVIYTSYAFYTFGWYVNYRKYNYIGVDCFDTLLITTIFLIIFFIIYIILRFKFLKKFYSSFLVFVKRNTVLLITLSISILIMCSSLVFGIYANKKEEPKKILDLVNYSYVTERNSVVLTCVYHNNTPADISKLDSVTVFIKDKNNQKTVSFETFHDVRFEDWCIKGNEESKIVLQIPYSLETMNLWEEENVELSISYRIE